MHQGKAAEFRLQGWRTTQNLLENLCPDSYPTSGHLHNCSKGSAQQANRDGHSYHSFASHDADFHTSAVRAQGDERGHALVKKVSKLDLLRGLVHDVVLRQF